MGVFHVSGLGFSPGAVTVPLSCVYCLLKLAYINNDQRAKEFFKSSGEAQGDEQYSGKPEALILLTSKDAAKKEIQSIDCRWGIVRGVNNIQNVNLIKTYLTVLTSKLELDYQPLPLKYMCVVYVDISNFDDMLLKSYITMKALLKKEVWINLVGGPNQVNLALVLASSLVGASTRFYYAFDWDSQRNAPSNSLNPTWFNLNNLNADTILNRWIDFPPVMLGWAEIISWIRDKFQNENKILNIGEVRNGLTNLNYDPERLIPKLRNTLLNIERDRVKTSALFEKFRNIITQAEQQNINDPSNWLRWCEKNGEVILRND